MLTILKIILIVLFVPLLLLSQNNLQTISPKQQQAIENAIFDVQAKMKAAAEQHNVDSLFQYVLEMDKGVIIENGRIRWTKQNALETTKKGFEGLKALTYTYTRKYVTVLSLTVALWVGEGSSSATLEDGRQFSVPFAESILFVQKEGQWRVLHAHRSVPVR